MHQRRGVLLCARTHNGRAGDPRRDAVALIKWKFIPRRALRWPVRSKEVAAVPLDLRCYA